MLQRTGAKSQSYPYWAAYAREVSHQCYKKSKIQRCHFPAYGTLLSTETRSQYSNFESLETTRSITPVFVLQVLFQQFKFFLNLYFLLMAISQFIPDIRIGYLYTYWGPLCFVLTVTIFREAVDDFRRYKRDKEVNAQKYYRLVKGFDTPELVPSSKLRVGDLVSHIAVSLSINYFYHNFLFMLTKFRYIN